MHLWIYFNLWFFWLKKSLTSITIHIMIRNMNTEPIYTPTTLGYALLGMIHQKPRSGYALLKQFETTPIGHFSSSPGAIYPALRQLKRHDLIEEMDVDGQEGQRQRKILHITSSGKNLLCKWLKHPVTHDDIIWRLDELLLRFAFMEHLVDTHDVIRFLDAFIRCIDLYIQTLTSIQTSGVVAQVSTLSDLALQNGIEVYRAHLKWGKQALKVVKVKI